jgi:hypothetical protein
LLFLINSYVNFLQTKERKILQTMENMSALLRQARLNMAEGPNFIPLEFVNMVRLRGDLESYTALEGHDLTTPEGQEMLMWNAAMYITCVDVCMRGVGHLPYQLLPNWGDPAIVDIDRDGPGNIAMEEIVGSDDEESEDEDVEDDLYPDSENDEDEVVVVGEFYPHLEQIIEGEVWILGDFRPEDLPAEDVPPPVEGEDEEPGGLADEVPLLAVQPNNHLAVDEV